MDMEKQLKEKIKTKRIEFTDRIKRQIVRDCNNICAFPDCDKKVVSTKITIQEEKEGWYQGEIAHIYPSSPSEKKGGFRYQEKILKDFIKSRENGLLLCSPHHDKIDDPINSEIFPAKLVLEMRKNHIANMKVPVFKEKNNIPHKDQDKTNKVQSVINDRKIQESFNFILKFIEKVFDGYKLDYITVVDNILEIQESRSKFRDYFDMIFSPPEINDSDPNPVECTVKFLDGKYSLNFFMDRNEIGHFFRGGTLQIAIRKDDGGSNGWSNIGTGAPREFLDKLWAEIQSYVKEKHNYDLTVLKFQSQKTQEDEIQNLLNKLSKLFDTLYKTKTKSSVLFTEEVINDYEMRKHFGITARKSDRSEIPDDDLPMSFLKGRYYLIPNSATLRKNSYQGQDNVLLGRGSTEQEVNQVLEGFFDDFIDFIKKENGLIITNPKI